MKGKGGTSRCGRRNVISRGPGGRWSVLSAGHWGRVVLIRAEAGEMLWVNHAGLHRLVCF